MKTACQCDVFLVVKHFSATNTADGTIWRQLTGGDGAWQYLSPIISQRDGGGSPSLGVGWPPSRHLRAR